MNIPFLTEIQSVFLPKYCWGCNSLLTSKEENICLHCRSLLPAFPISFLEAHFIKERISLHIPIAQAVTLFLYEKRGIVQQLIHSLKYRSQEEIGTFLGNWLGNLLRTSGNFSNIDFVVGVPLHKKKLEKRGYNQVTTFGKQIAKNLQIPYYEDFLTRTKNNAQQAKNNWEKRNKDTESLFDVNTKLLSNMTQHILIIDDIITTGSTLVQCAERINQFSNCKISFACMGITSDS